MSDLRKISDPNLSQEELDHILERAIRAKFDAEMRKNWERKLQDEYGVTKNKPAYLFSLSRRSIVYVVGIAASLLVLVVALNLFISSSETAQHMAVAYIEKTEIYYPDNSKGAEETTENARAKAVDAFNTKKYAEAANYFTSIESKTEEDQYYGALASLLSKDYAAAVEKFTALSSQVSTRPEAINWYLSIALILNEEEEEAKTTLANIQAGDWNFEKAQDLLKAMK